MHLTEQQQKMVEDNYNLVYHVLHKLKIPYEKWDDYVQAGSEGLCKAVLKFNPEYGCLFSTYAVPLIWGEMQRYYRDYDGQFIRIPRKEFDQKKFPGMVYLDEPIHDQDGNKVDMYNLIEDNKEHVDVEDSMIFEMVRKAVSSTLDERDKKIYTLRFEKGMTQMDTAAAVGISQAHLSRLESRIRNKIKNQMVV